LILLVDEVDQLVDKRQQLLYTLFDMASTATRPFILITIANSLSFCEENLRLQSRLSRVERCVFRDYEVSDMLNIVKSRLSRDALRFFPDSRVSSLLVHRIIAAGGDVRTLLHATADLYGTAFARHAHSLASAQVSDEGSRAEARDVPTNAEQEKDGAGGKNSPIAPGCSHPSSPCERGPPRHTELQSFSIGFRDVDAVTNPGIADTKILETCYSPFDQNVYLSVAKYHCQKIKDIMERMDQLVDGVSSLAELRPVKVTYYHEVVRSLQKLEAGGFLLLDVGRAMTPATEVILLN